MTPDATARIVAWSAIGIAAILSLVILWALRGDRSNGRRRCGRCWYDMSGSPGLRCPECGHEARHERGLMRTRRRWRVVAISLLMMVVALGAGVVPVAHRSGWASLLPESALVRSLMPAGQERRPTGQVHWATVEMLRRFSNKDLSPSAIRDAIEHQRCVQPIAWTGSTSTALIRVLTPEWAGTTFMHTMVHDGEQRRGTLRILRGSPLLNELYQEVAVVRDPSADPERVLIKGQIEAFGMPPVPSQFQFGLGEFKVSTEWLASDEATEMVRSSIRWNPLESPSVFRGFAIFPAAEWVDGSPFAFFGVRLEIHFERGLGWERLGEVDLNPTYGTRVMATQLMPSWSRSSETLVFPLDHATPKEDFGSLADRILPRERWRVRVKGTPFESLDISGFSLHWRGEFEVPYLDVVRRP